MKITCQSCQSKYTVSDEKVQGKTVKIKCRKCGATILVNSGGVTTTGGGVADPVSLSSGGTADSGTSYLVNVTEGDQRTMTLPEVVAAYHSSVVTADTYVWADGMSDWMPLSQVDAIVTALNAPTSTAPPAPSAPPPAVAEPEHRAAARRDPARRAQDLFSSRAPEEQSSAPAYNGSAPAAARPAAAGPPATGQREENSMLFSLSALTAKVGSSSSSPSSAPSALSAPRATTARDREDSGIIDLKALAAAAQSQSAQPAAASMMPDMGMFPLGAPALSVPIAAPPVVSSSTPPPKNKTPIFIGVGAVVALVAIVGAFVAMKGGPPPQDAPIAANGAAPPEAATVTATPTATATATTAPVDTAAAAASASASAAAVAANSKGGGKGAPAGASRGGGAAPSRGGGAAPAAPAAAAPAAPAGPKKGSCGCAPGDLMCAMKCSAK